jgi:N-alpha-acetyl-L-2,4-diaminobutyrate deacetylase
MPNPGFDAPLESTTFAGLAPGTHLLVTGGVHGNEPCGTRAIRRAIAACQSGEIAIRRGLVTFVPVCNPKAFAQYTREGDRNLNRDLREKPLPQDFEDRVGNRLCSIIRQHDVLLDIHSFKGSGPPFVFFGPENNRGPLEPFRHAEAELAFAAQLGVDLLIHGWLGIYEQTITLRNRLDLPKLAVTEGFGTTEFMRFCGGYAATLECGQHEDPEAPELGYRAILSTLAHCQLIDAPEPPRAAKRITAMTNVVLCEREGDRLEGQWSTADAVTRGSLLARRADGTALTAPFDGMIIFPNPTAKPGEALYYLGQPSPRMF